MESAQRKNLWKKLGNWQNIMGQAPGITVMLWLRQSCTARSETLEFFPEGFAVVPSAQCIHTRGMLSATHCSTIFSVLAAFVTIITPSIAEGIDRRSE